MIRVSCYFHHLEKSVADEDTCDGFSESAGEEVCCGQVRQEDVVGGSGQVRKISQCDTQEDVDHGAEQGEEELGEHQQSGFPLLHAGLGRHGSLAATPGLYCLLFTK